MSNGAVRHYKMRIVRQFHQQVLYAVMLLLFLEWLA